MQQDPLPDAADAHGQLQSKLATLVVPVQDGAASSTLAKSISGQQYTFSANDRGIEMMGIECSPDGGETTLLVRRDGTEQRVACGDHRWIKGRLMYRLFRAPLSKRLPAAVHGLLTIRSPPRSVLQKPRIA